MKDEGTSGPLTICRIDLDYLVACPCLLYVIFGKHLNFKTKYV